MPKRPERLGKYTWRSFIIYEDGSSKKQPQYHVIPLDIRVENSLSDGDFVEIFCLEKLALLPRKIRVRLTSGGEFKLDQEPGPGISEIYFSLRSDFNVLIEGFSIFDTESQKIAKIRKSLGLRRKFLAQNRAECAFSGLMLPQALEVAHIYPWCLASDYERGDMNNLLLLSATVHRLFDAKMINVDLDGSILSGFDRQEHQIFGLRDRIDGMTPETLRYLERRNAIEIA